MAASASDDRRREARLLRSLWPKAFSSCCRVLALIEGRKRYVEQHHKRPLNPIHDAYFNQLTPRKASKNHFNPSRCLFRKGNFCAKRGLPPDGYSLAGVVAAQGSGL
jgi:hypothetical protein